MPSNLLIAKRRKDKILPVYAELNQTNLEMAESISELYQAHIGRKKAELSQAVAELENLAYDYRFIRGLATILDRRCRLETQTKIDPLEVRRKIFEATSEIGIPTTEEERSVILERVAGEFKADTAALIGSLYGDLEDEMLVKSFDLISPSDLLKEYNLSLTQTMFFNAYELSFTASGNWQQIFRRIKHLGLIYSISSSNSDYWVKVDGPTSLFKLTKRYGTILAKLVPTILDSGYWSVNAKIIDRLDRARLLSLELDSIKHGRYMKTARNEETFDSTIEEDFAVRFNSLRTGWELLREPNPLLVGRQIMIPDFLLKKGGLKVYLEIVGFWTPEYLRDKMRKLMMVKNVDMIVAVNRHLACKKPTKTDGPINLFYYKEKVPLKPVLDYIRDKEDKLVGSEIEILHERELKLTSPVADTKDIAEMLGISVETVQRILPDLKAPGYQRFGDVFVRETLLYAVNKALEDKLKSGNLNFVDASGLIVSMGGRNASAILEALGFQIIWHGINPESTEIRKKKRTQQDSSP